MTRRDLGKLAAVGSAALLPAVPPMARGETPSAYGGPLEGFEDKVPPAAIDPVLFSRRLYEAAPLKITFRAHTRKQAEAWQKRCAPN